MTETDRSIGFGADSPAPEEAKFRSGSTHPEFEAWWAVFGEPLNMGPKMSSYYLAFAAWIAATQCADESWKEIRAAPRASRGPSETATIEVIVNGQPVRVPTGPIRVVIADAIQVAGQIGAPIDQWVLCTREGDIIPHQLPCGLEYALAGGQRVFMHLGPPPAPPPAEPEGR